MKKRGGPTAFNYVTPEELKALGDIRTVEELRTMAKKGGTCSNCDLPVWRYGGCGMCFPCTTGDSDASEDFELFERGNDDT